MRASWRRFRLYGLPAPEVFVDLIGALEVVGG